MTVYNRVNADEEEKMQAEWYLIDPHHWNESTDGTCTSGSEGEERRHAELSVRRMIHLLGRAIVVEYESIDPGVGVQLNAHLSSNGSTGQWLEVDRRFVFVEVRLEGNVDR